MLSPPSYARLRLWSVIGSFLNCVSALQHWQRPRRRSMCILWQDLDLDRAHPDRELHRQRGAAEMPLQDLLAIPLLDLRRIIFASIFLHTRRPSMLHSRLDLCHRILPAPGHRSYDIKHRSSDRFSYAFSAIALATIRWRNSWFTRRILDIAGGPILALPFAVLWLSPKARGWAWATPSSCSIGWCSASLRAPTSLSWF